LSESNYNNTKKNFKLLVPNLPAEDIEKTPCNIIFELNRHKPFTDDLRFIYRFILNAFISELPEETKKVLSPQDKEEKRLLKQYVFSFCLDHAITCNNLDAINILITEYKISAFDQVRLNGQNGCLPILQIFNHNGQEPCSVSLAEQMQKENTLIYVLRCLNFSDSSITASEVTYIFERIYENGLEQAFNALLQKNSFLQKFKLEENHLILFAIAECVSLEPQIKMHKQLMAMMSNVSPDWKRRAIEANVKIQEHSDMLKTTLSKRGILTVSMVVEQMLLEQIKCLSANHKKIEQMFLRLMEENKKAIANYEQKIKEINQKLTQQEEQTEKTNKRVAELTGNKIISEEEIEKLKTQIEGLKKDSKEAIRKKDLELQEKEDEIQKQQKENEARAEKLAESESKAKKANDDADKYRRELTGAQEVLESSDTEGSKFTMWLPTLETRRGRDMQKISNLERIIRDIKERDQAMRIIRKERAIEREKIIEQQKEDLAELTIKCSDYQQAINALSTVDADAGEKIKIEKFLEDFRYRNRIDIEDPQKLLEYVSEQLTKFRLLTNNNRGSNNVRARSFSIG